MQRMEGVGACSYAFPFADDQEWRWEDVRFVFDELDLRYIRLASWFGWWETENDNDDPNAIDWDGFQTDLQIIDWHDEPYAEYLNDRGIEVALGVWDVGDWLAGGSPRSIDPALYPELGESIAAYLLNMESIGVPQTVTEVQNEPAIEAGIQYPSPEALRDAALAVLDQLDANDLGEVMLHGPNFHQPEGAAEWAEVWLADERLRDRTVAVSYHTWWNDEREPYDAILEVAKRYGKPVWATEVGYCALAEGCFGGTHFLLPETWGTAWDYAMSYYRAIAWTEATRVYHWTVLGHDAVVSPNGERYPSFYILRHFSNFIADGASQLETASGDDAVLALAFSMPEGGYTAILLNTGTASRSMLLRGVTAAALSASESYQTSENAPWQEVAPIEEEGGLRLELVPESVTSVRLTAQ